MNLLEPPSVPSDDRGFLLGDGLFETVRLYGGRPFRLEAHLGRMDSAARLLGIEVPRETLDRVTGAIERWGARDGALRLTLTRGSGEGLAAPGVCSPRLVVSVSHLPTAGSGGDREGLRARVLGRVDERALVAGVKVLGFAERIQALRLARIEGADEALLRNTRGELVEGTTSNLIAIRGRTMIAPGGRCGVLPGITREVLLRVAAGAGFRVEDRPLASPEIRRLDELLLSSSIREVVPVVEVDGCVIADGRAGRGFEILASGYAEAIREEFASQ